MPVEFERETQTASFHSPLEEFGAVDVDVEVRIDPLTGRQSRIVPDNFLLPDDDPDITDVVEDDGGCFFCPGAVEEATPTYPDWMDVERGAVGEATSFPNLNPYGAYSNVVALTAEHFVPLGEFTVEHFADGLAAALQYAKQVFEHDDSTAYASVNMNFLRPAGSSVIHPHLQTLVDARGTNAQRVDADAARDYYDEHDTVYWSDLAIEERGGDRYVAELGNVHWLAPFAPKHHRHLLGVADQTKTGLPEPRGDVARNFAAGLVNALSYYDEVGLNSFNVAMYVARDDPAVPPVMHVVGRSVFDRFYWSDSPFFTVLHDEGVVDVAPEEYGKAAHKHF